MPKDTTKKPLQTFLKEGGWYTYTISKELTPNNFIPIPDTKVIDNNKVYRRYIQQHMNDINAVCRNAIQLQRPHAPGHHRKVTAPLVTLAIGLVGLGASLASSINTIVGGSYTITDRNNTAPGISQIVTGSLNIVVFWTSAFFIVIGACLGISGMRAEQLYQEELELFEKQKELRKRLPELYQEIQLKEEAVTAVLDFLNYDEQKLNGNPIPSQEKSRLAIALIQAIDKNDNLNIYTNILDTMPKHKFFIDKKSAAIYVLLLSQIYKYYVETNQIYFQQYSCYNKSIFELLIFLEQNPPARDEDSIIINVFFKELTTVLSNKNRLEAAEVLFNFAAKKSMNYKDIRQISFLISLLDKFDNYKIFKENLIILDNDYEKEKSFIDSIKNKLGYSVSLEDVNDFSNIFTDDGRHQEQIKNLLDSVMQALSTENYFTDSELCKYSISSLRR